MLVVKFLKKPAVLLTLGKRHIYLNIFSLMVFFYKMFLKFSSHYIAYGPLRSMYNPSLSILSPLSETFVPRFQTFRNRYYRRQGWTPSTGNFPMSQKRGNFNLHWHHKTLWAVGLVSYPRDDVPAFFSPVKILQHCLDRMRKLGLPRVVKVGHQADRDYLNIERIINLNFCGFKFKNLNYEF